MSLSQAREQGKAGRQAGGRLSPALLPTAEVGEGAGLVVEWRGPGDPAAFHSGVSIYTLSDH